MSSPSNIIQSSFAAGELAPSLHARVDLAKYSTGLKTARNVNILAHGGVRNRPGTYMVAPAGNSTYKVRNVAFVYADGQSYNIEFGQGYIRFFTADAPIMVSSTVTTWITSTAYVVGQFVTHNTITYYCVVAHTSGTFTTDLAAGKWIDQMVYQIPSPYLSAEIFDLKVNQSADYLYIDHPLHAPQQLIRLANDSWQLTPFPFKNGPFMLSNTSPAKTLTSNAIAVAYSTDHTISQVISGFSFSGSTFVELATSSAHGLINGDTVKITLLDGAAATALNNNIYSVGIVDATTLLLRYQGTLSAVVIPTFTTYTPGAGKASSVGPATITANFPLFNALHVGALFQMVETIPAQTISAALATTVATTSINCGHTWRVITTGGWTGNIVIQMSTEGVNGPWNALRSLQGGGTDNYDTSGDTGASQCFVRALGTFTGSGVTVNLTSDTFDWIGVIQIATVASPTSATATILSEQGVGVGLASINATSQWAEGSWSNYRGWPSCSTFFQDRLCFGGTKSEPNRWDASQTGDYTNFGVSDPLVDSDAISALLPSRTVNIIKNMCVLGSLVVLTSDSDFSIEPGSNGVLSPTSINITCHGHRGTSGTTPAIVGNEIVLVQQMGSVIRNLIYQFSVSGYMGDNIGIVSQHLLTDYDIVEMAYQQEPDSIVWAVRSDGVLLSMTYLREQEVIAWSHHDTNGGTDLFESVSVIPSSILGINEVWVVVNRGGTRYIERMAPRDMGSNVANYMMLDCATTQTTGLNILAIEPLNTPPQNCLIATEQKHGLSAGGKVTLSGITLNTALNTTFLVGTINDDYSFFIKNLITGADIDSGLNVAQDGHYIVYGTATPYRNTVTGISYLNGKTVVALVDGNEVTGLTVANGATTLPVAGKIVHIGLPYISDVETLRIESPDNLGTTQGRKIAIPMVTIRFWNSRGGYLGTTSQDSAAIASSGVVGLDEIPQHEPGDVMSGPVQLKTRDYQFTPNGGYDFGTSIFFRQVSPLPFYISAFVPKVVKGDS